jgi:hypothetical protein
MSLGVDEGAIAGRLVDACGLPFACLHSLAGERLELADRRDRSSSVVRVRRLSPELLDPTPSGQSGRPERWRLGIEERP